MQGPSNFKNRSNKEVVNAALMVAGAASASKSLAAKTVKILVPKTIGNKLDIRGAEKQYQKSLSNFDKEMFNKYGTRPKFIKK